MRVKRASVAALRAAKLSGHVCRRTHLPREHVAEYLCRYSYLEGSELEEIAHAWLSGYDQLGVQLNWKDRAGAPVYDR